MFPNAPTLFLLTVILAVAVISTVGFSVVWILFAATLAVTTVVAVQRSIPRRERLPRPALQRGRPAPRKDAP